MNTASIRGSYGPREQADSWKNPTRMLYLVTIEVLGSGDIRTTSFHVANFHNAAAISQAFADVTTVNVVIEPDVLAYLGRAPRRHLTVLRDF